MIYPDFIAATARVEEVKKWTLCLFYRKRERIFIPFHTQQQLLIVRNNTQ